MRISLYFLCLQDSGLLACTIRSFIDSWTFSSIMSDYCLIPVILISFSGVSVIFRLDNFSIYPCLFIFFLLVPYVLGKIFYVRFLHYRFNIFISFLFFSVPRKDFWFCYCISSCLTVSFKFFSLFQTFSCYSPTVDFISATTFPKASAPIS